MKMYSSNSGWPVKPKERLVDIHWHLHSPEITLSRSAVRSRWKCGDSKKLKTLSSRFSKNSTMHGAKYMCTAGSNISIVMKILYRCFCVFCLMSVLGNLIVLIQEGLRAESVYVVTTDKDTVSGMEDDPYFPHGPKMTICRMPGYRTDINKSLQELTEYAYISLGLPLSPLTPTERANAVMYAARLRHKEKSGNSSRSGEIIPDIIQTAMHLERMNVLFEEYKKNNKDFDLTEFIISNSLRCEDIFESCVVVVFRVKCCDIFRPQLTAFGVCFIAMPDQRLFAYEQKRRAIEFSYSVDFRPLPFVEKDIDVGYQVFLTDPRQTEFQIDGTGGVAVTRGWVTSVRAKLIKTDRTAVYTPWHGLSNNCPVLPPDLDFSNVGERYFRKSCEVLYVNSRLQRDCDCRSVTDRSKSILPYRPCDPSDWYKCFMIEALRDNLSTVDELCPEPCIEYGYQVQTSHFELGGVNNSRVLIVIDALQYVSNEYRTTTISGILSQIGGALGLYIGASLLTVLELINFVACWLWYRLLPTRKIEPIRNYSSRDFTRHQGLHLY